MMRWLSAVSISALINLVFHKRWYDHRSESMASSLPRMGQEAISRAVPVKRRGTQHGEA